MSWFVKDLPLEFTMATAAGSCGSLPIIASKSSFSILLIALSSPFTLISDFTSASCGSETSSHRTFPLAAPATTRAPAIHLATLRKPLLRLASSILNKIADDSNIFLRDPLGKWCNN
uniref:Uncharacterized protein n=1 Tax=Babesia bovis TaxID=5865 RepID=S6BFY6_BABBO|nr:hypothetical protein [Babesia bovis]BAN65346.1 hypothetical protein [Babesia bovis]